VKARTVLAFSLARSAGRASSVAAAIQFLRLQFQLIDQPGASF
jgi:hypothetical protein